MRRRVIVLASAAALAIAVAIAAIGFMLGRMRGFNRQMNDGIRLQAMSARIIDHAHARGGHPRQDELVSVLGGAPLDVLGQPIVYGVVADTDGISHVVPVAVGADGRLDEPLDMLFHREGRIDFELDRDIVVVDGQVRQGVAK